jgi:2-hydroxychromene-2-carboxylate isomerase
VALAGLEQDWGPAFCRRVFAAEFERGRPIAEPAVLAEILAALGVAADRMLERAASPEIKARLRAATERAAGLGIFGAPSFVTAAGELFWGNDRLEAALDWAARAGDG